MPLNYPANVRAMIRELEEERKNENEERPKKKVGRPRKYATLEDAKIAREKHRILKEIQRARDGFTRCAKILHKRGHTVEQLCQIITFMINLNKKEEEEVEKKVEEKEEEEED